MSYPTIPNVTPLISITTAQAVPLLLASIALEELSLAHIMNSEAEKMQLMLGTLPGGTTLFPSVVTLSNLLDMDRSVQRTLREVIMKEMLLEFKFENILELITTPGGGIVPPTPPAAACGCQITNQAGNAFGVNRGNTTVIITSGTTTTTDTGTVDFAGIFCSACSSANNSFTFTFNPSGGANTTTFTATTFNVSGCPTGTAVITGQGNVSGPLAATIGTPATYILTVTTTSLNLTITGPTGSLTTSIPDTGVGEIVLSNCP